MPAADARGVALASLERVEEAEAEAVLFEQARSKVPATRKHMICRLRSHAATGLLFCLCLSGLFLLYM